MEGLVIQSDFITGYILWDFTCGRMAFLLPFPTPVFFIYECEFYF